MIPESFKLSNGRAWAFLLCSVVILAACQPVSAQFAPPVAAADGVVGFWSTDAGSVLQVDRCGENVCITIRTISKKAPGVVDGHNPDVALRARPICKLDIGTGFKLTDPDHAVGGRIYDPETGKTYKSVMASDGTNSICGAMSVSKLWDARRPGIAPQSSTPRAWARRIDKE